MCVRLRERLRPCWLFFSSIRVYNFFQRKVDYLMYSVWPHARPEQQQQRVEVVRTTTHPNTHAARVRWRHNREHVGLVVFVCVWVFVRRLALAFSDQNTDTVSLSRLRCVGYLLLLLIIGMHLYNKYIISNSITLFPNSVIISHLATKSANNRTILKIICNSSRHVCLLCLAIFCSVCVRFTMI